MEDEPSAESALNLCHVKEYTNVKLHAIIAEIRGTIAAWWREAACATSVNYGFLLRRAGWLTSAMACAAVGSGAQIADGSWLKSVSLRTSATKVSVDVVAQ